jgi:hypothetical protein
MTLVRSRYDVFTGNAVTLLSEEHHREVLFGGTETVDAAHACNHDRIGAFEDRLRRGVTHFVDLFVDGGILFDVGISAWDVGFGLVIIVIADEVPHPIARKEFHEFGVQLGCQCLVGGDHQCRTVLLRGDHIRHRKGLSRPGHAKQGLIPHSILKIFVNTPNCAGLIAAGLKFGRELEVHDLRRRDRRRARSSGHS